METWKIFALRDDNIDRLSIKWDICPMKTSICFANELFRIVNGALRLDTGKVRNYTALLAEKLENAGESDVADRLLKMLEDTDNQLKPADIHSSGILPVDSESRFPLVERVKVKDINEPPMLLGSEQWDMVNEFVSISKNHGVIDMGELSGALSLLMYGAPGTGKSRLARHIAKELGLDLYVVRLDGLISSFLGSTSKNIRAVFDFAAKTPCVLFLDEFDAIAKLRGDNNEMGELKRVVNSFLQNLDTLGREAIILAATNHESLLDSAVWRRFPYRLALQLPTEEKRAEMWALFSEPIEFAQRELEVLANLSEGYSGADIRELCIRLKRRALATGRPISLRDAYKILLNLSLAEDGNPRFTVELLSLDSREAIRSLKKRSPRLFTYAVIAELLGVSKSLVHRLYRQEGDGIGSKTSGKAAGREVSNQNCLTQARE